MRHSRIKVVCMNIETLRALLTRQPFEPLRIKTSNGEEFDSWHPQMVGVARSAMLIVRPDADGSPSDKVEYVSYVHITSVDTLAGAASP